MTYVNAHERERDSSSERKRERERALGIRAERERYVKNCGGSSRQKHWTTHHYALHRPIFLFPPFIPFLRVSLSLFQDARLYPIIYSSIYSLDHDFSCFNGNYNLSSFVARTNEETGLIRRVRELKRKIAEELQKEEKETARKLSRQRWRRNIWQWVLNFSSTISMSTQQVTLGNSGIMLLKFNYRGFQFCSNNYSSRIVIERRRSRRIKLGGRQNRIL